MKYKLKPTKAFVKNLKKLSKNEQKLVVNKLKLLERNPFYPSLRPKKLKGILILLKLVSIWILEYYGDMKMIK